MDKFNYFKIQHEETIAEIDKLLNYSCKYCENCKESNEFKYLANFLLEIISNKKFLTINLDHNFSSHYMNSFDFLNLLKIIHHAMIDDGDITFVTTQDNYPMIIFQDKQKIKEKYPNYKILKDGFEYCNAVENFFLIERINKLGYYIHDAYLNIRKKKIIL